MQGFKTFERKGIRVGTQQFITLDVTLEVGTVEESITVTADAPLIETSNASHAEVMDAKMLETLPSIGGNVFLMAVTVPTVQSSGDTHWNRMQDQTGASAISLGGGGVRSNNYLLDGFPVTDLQNRSSTNPSGEMVEDIRVQVHTYDAEMGRTGGGVLNTTAKSGIKHVPRLGLLPEPAERADRPAVLQPDSRHRKLAAVLAQVRRRRRRPACCKNRTFFWAAGEGYRDGLSQNDEDDTCPPRRCATATSAASATRPGNMIPIYDPLTTNAAGDRPAVPRQHHSAEPHQPVGARVSQGDSAAGHRIVDDRQRQPAGAGRASTTRRSRVR